MENLGLLDVEPRVQRSLADQMFMEFAKKYMKYANTLEEFIEFLDEGLYEKLVSEVKYSYAFMGDIDLTVTKEELYLVYKKYR
jgi:hypothetical protein